MAHADYKCCAVCDSKLAYSDSPRSKEDICGPCVANLARQGVICGTPEELGKWVEETSADKVQEVLKAVNYYPCIYQGEIDEVVEKKLPGVFARA